MLAREHALGERGGCVTGEHRHPTLGHDRAVVVVRVDHVDGHAGLALSGRQHGLVHPRAVHPLPAEPRQQRRMDVEDAVAIARQRAGPELLHVPREDDELGVMARERLEDGGVERVGVRMRGPAQVVAREAGASRPLEALPRPGCCRSARPASRGAGPTHTRRGPPACRSRDVTRGTLSARRGRAVTHPRGPRTPSARCAVRPLRPSAGATTRARPRAARDRCPPPPPGVDGLAEEARALDRPAEHVDVLVLGVGRRDDLDLVRADGERHVRARHQPVARDAERQVAVRDGVGLRRHPVDHVSLADELGDEARPRLVERARPRSRPAPPDRAPAPRCGRR